MSFSFQVSAKVLGSLKRLIDYTPTIAGRWKSCFKTLNLHVSEPKRDIAPKQRCDRFPSAGNHIHATVTFEHAWATPRHTFVGGS